MNTLSFLAKKEYRVRFEPEPLPLNYNTSISITTSICHTRPMTALTTEAADKVSHWVRILRYAMHAWCIYAIKGKVWTGYRWVNTHILYIGEFCSDALHVGIIQPPAWWPYASQSELGLLDKALVSFMFCHLFFLMYVNAHAHKDVNITDNEFKYDFNPDRMLLDISLQIYNTQGHFQSITFYSTAWNPKKFNRTWTVTYIYCNIYTILS